MHLRVLLLFVVCVVIVVTAGAMVPPKPVRLAGFVPEGVSPLGSPHSPHPPQLRQPVAGK